MEKIKLVSYLFLMVIPVSIKAQRLPQKLDYINAVEQNVLYSTPRSIWSMFWNGNFQHIKRQLYDEKGGISRTFSADSVYDLIVFNCPRGVLDANIFRFRQIRSLGINCPLKRIDPRVWDFPHLQILGIRSDSLTVMPPGISKLKSTLVSLSLSKRNPTNINITLNREIFELNNLIELEFRNLGMRSVPVQISQMHNLRVIYLDENPIRTVPLSILRLPNLLNLTWENSLITDQETRRLQQYQLRYARN